MTMLDAPFRLSLRCAPPGAPSVRACQAARVYGLNLERAGRPVRSAALDLAPGSSTLIVGCSGAGKTTLLDGAEREARARLWRVVRPERVRLRRAPAVDQFPRDTPEGAMRRLAGAGLGEAMCFVRRPGELSAGQLARLRLAVAMERASRGSHDALLLVDAFASGLDRLTAQSLLALLARWAGGPGRRRALCAASDETLAALAPPEARTVRVDPSGRLSPIDPPRERDPFVIDLRPPARDVREASRRLAGLHYRSRPARGVVRTLLARDASTGEPVGALHAAMPTLNGRLRDLAWPGRYATGDRRLDAARLNEEVRRVARVVVDPRVRSMGLATRLVRAYLDSPLTRRTEAIAAMGRCCRFFERAGMTPWTLPPAPGDARLLDALRYAGVEPWRMATPRAAHRRAIASLTRRLGERAARAFLDHELRQWAGSGRARRAALREDSQESRFIHACAVCMEGAVGYAHDAGE